MFWKGSGGWENNIRERMADGIALALEHDVPLIVSIWERYKVWDEGHDVAVYTPLSDEALALILEIAFVPGDDERIVWFWSNTYTILDRNDPAKILAETVGRDDDYDPLPAVNAVMVQMMAEMRLQAELVR